MRSSLIFLAHLDDADIAWMQTAGRKRPMSADEDVIASGIVNQDLYLLLAGTCRVAAPDGRPLDTLHSGDIIGEVSFVDGRLTTARAHVSADSGAVLAHFSAKVMQEQLAADLGFASRFYRGIASVLAYRLRRNLQFALGVGVDVLDSDKTYAGEVDPADLEVTARAGARLNHLIKALT